MRSRRLFAGLALVRLNSRCFAYLAPRFAGLDKVPSLDLRLPLLSQRSVYGRMCAVLGG